MMKKAFLALTLVAAATQASALTTGDLAFTSFNADEDGWSMVTFADIAANTTVYFSDNEWLGSAFNTGEGQHTWTSGNSLIAAGSVIRFSAVDQATRSVNYGSLSSTGDTGLNATSETVYAYLGTSANSPTTFLAGVSSEGTTNLAPAGLTSGTYAVVVTNSTDYAEYIGPRSGKASFSDYRSLVNNSANWKISVGGDQGAQVPSMTAFSVTAVPEPETYAMLLAGLALMGSIARRRNNQA